MFLIYIFPSTSRFSQCSLSFVSNRVFSTQFTFVVFFFSNLFNLARFMVSLVCQRSNLVYLFSFSSVFPPVPFQISGRDPLVVVECCNAPDTTFHIHNSNSCLFRCQVIFISRVRVLVSVCCFRFHASHLIASCTLHRHRFHKTCIRSGSAGSLRCPF